VISSLPFFYNPPYSNGGAAMNKRMVLAMIVVGLMVMGAYSSGVGQLADSP